MWEMTVAVTPSLNQVKRWQHARQHWRLGSLKESWGLGFAKELIISGASSANVAGAPPKRRVEIVRHGSRDLDFDNLVGGCKGLVDALVLSGWLRDDSEKWADVRYYQEKCKRGEERTVVRVWDA